ncbi:MAG: hypothetical protein II098_10155 [Treponema sp.]|nr:hypothetical protein [Treponema sp.]
MRTARIDFNKNLSSSILFKLTRRTVLFLFLFTLSLILLYFIGNFQQFLDSTQTILIKTLTISAAALFVLSCAAFIESIVFIIIKKSRRIYYAAHSIMLLSAAVFGVATMITATSLFIISEGL